MTLTTLYDAMRFVTHLVISFAKGNFVTKSRGGGGGGRNQFERNGDYEFQLMETEIRTEFILPNGVASRGGVERRINTGARKNKNGRN